MAEQINVGNIETIDLDEMKDHDELLQAARQIQQAYKAKSQAFWPGRQWVPAELDYPGEPAGHINSSRAFNPPVIVFNCKTQKFHVSELDKLTGKSYTGEMSRSELLLRTKHRIPISLRSTPFSLHKDTLHPRRADNAERGLNNSPVPDQ